MALLSNKFDNVKGILELGMIVITFLIFWFCKNDILKMGNATSNNRFRRHRRILRDQTSIPPKKQSLEGMKRIAVKKNGQYTYYRINKYGEIFEE